MCRLAVDVGYDFEDNGSLEGLIAYKDALAGLVNLIAVGALECRRGRVSSAAVCRTLFFFGLGTEPEYRRSMADIKHADDDGTYGWGFVAENESAHAQ